MKYVKLKVILFAISHVLRHAIKKHAVVQKHVGSQNCVLQIKLRDNSVGRYYHISSAGVQSKAGFHPQPDVIVDLKDVDTALMFLNPKPDQAEIIHAVKNFRVLVIGPDNLVVWFSQLMNMTQR